jgi:hypothetical protein
MLFPRPIPHLTNYLTLCSSDVIAPDNLISRFPSCFSPEHLIDFLMTDFTDFLTLISLKTLFFLAAEFKKTPENF